MSAFKKYKVRLIFDQYGIECHWGEEVSDTTPIDAVMACYASFEEQYPHLVISHLKLFCEEIKNG